MENAATNTKEELVAEMAVSRKRLARKGLGAKVGMLSSSDQGRMLSWERGTPVVPVGERGG